MVLRQLLRLEYREESKTGYRESNSAFFAIQPYWHLIPPPNLDLDISKLWYQWNEDDSHREYFFGFGFLDWEEVCCQVEDSMMERYASHMEDADDTDRFFPVPPPPIPVDGELEILRRVNDAGGRVVTITVLPGKHSVVQGENQVVFKQELAKYW